MAYFEPGTTLYLYTIRSGTFRVHKGKVTINTRNRWHPYMVTFETRQAKERCPDLEEIGTIQTSGPRLWMTERDDDKAKQMFIEFEKGKLAELENQVAKKKTLIKMLESVGMED